MGLKIEKAEREISRLEGKSSPWFKKEKSSGSTKRSTSMSKKRKKTRSEKLKEKRRTKYSSPDTNPDGSLSKPAYDSEISSISSKRSSSVTRELWKLKLQHYVGKVKRATFSWVGIVLLLSVLVLGATAVDGDLTSGGVGDIELFGSADDGETGADADDTDSDESDGDTPDTSDTDESDDDSSSAYGPGSFDEGEVEDLVLEYINEARFDDERPRVEMQYSLRLMARQHSDRMHEHDQLGHDVAGSTSHDRLSRAGCEYGSENVAQSWADELVIFDDGETIQTNDEDALARALVVSWLNSPGHSSNLRDPDWRVTGIGVTIDDDSGIVYATQKFCHAA